MVTRSAEGTPARFKVVMILHFFGLRFMMFCWAHCEMQSMSFCRDDTSPKLETSDIVTSSTCFQWLERKGGVSSQVVDHYQKKDWTQFGALGDTGMFGHPL